MKIKTKGDRNMNWKLYEEGRDKIEFGLFGIRSSKVEADVIHVFKFTPFDTSTCSRIYRYFHVKNKNYRYFSTNLFSHPNHYYFLGSVILIDLTYFKFFFFFDRLICKKFHLNRLFVLHVRIIFFLITTTSLLTCFVNDLKGICRF